MKKISLPFFLNSLFLLAAAALYPATYFNRSFMKLFFARGGYYLVLLLAGLWAIYLFRFFWRRRPELGQFLRSYGAGLILSLSLTSAVFMSVPPTFRVLSDETSLLSVSRSMVYQRSTDNVLLGKWHFDNFHPVSSVVPKRPLMFPLFTSALHTFSGYRAENVFVLNFLVLFSLLFFIFWAVKRYSGSALWAVSALFLVLCQPVVTQTASSGGFDLLACLFMLVLIANLAWFLSVPAAESFE